MIKLEWDHLILILAVTATHNNLILDLSFLISWAAQSRQPLDIGCWNCHRSFIICFADVHMPFKILCLSVQFTHTKSHHSTTSFYITYLVKQTVNFPFSPFPHLWKSLQFLCVFDFNNHEICDISPVFVSSILLSPFLRILHMLQLAYLFDGHWVAFIVQLVKE